MGSLKFCGMVHCSFTLVLGLMAASRLARFVQSTSEISMPILVVHCRNMRLVPEATIRQHQYGVSRNLHVVQLSYNCYTDVIACDAKFMVLIYCEII